MKRVNRMRQMTQSVRDGEMSYQRFAWELRYPSATLASVVSLVMLFVLMSCSYVSLWFALVIVFLTWVGMFSGIVASTIAWYDNLLSEGQRQQDSYEDDYWDYEDDYDENGN